MPTLKRFFDDSLDNGSSLVKISGDEFHHLKNVLRLSVGERVLVFNGRGLEAEGTIESIERDSASIRIGSVSDLKGLRESPVKIAVLQGLLKGDKNELVVQKLTELGVSEVSFFGGGRAIAEIKDEGEGSGRLKRLKRAAIEAAKQSGRSMLPEIKIFNDIRAACAGRKDALRIVLWEDESTMHLSDLLMKDALSVSILIGPEGGFSADEIKEAASAGFRPASMGPRRLRSETAAIAAAAIIGYSLGDLSIRA
jgi:16S rRNA (uracil1498-N3)-methyltransferase